MQDCIHDPCFTNIYVKHESITVGDLYKAQKKFKLMSYAFTNNKDEREIIKGPLSFVEGNLTVFVVSTQGTQFMKPCLNEGLKKSKKSAS